MCIVESDTHLFMKGVAMATNESTHVDPTEDDAIDEANEQAAKESRRLMLKRSLAIAAAVATPMLLIFISMTAFTGGVAIAWVQVLLLPVVAMFVQFKRKKWDGRPIADLWQFWLLAWVPAVVMAVVLLVSLGFTNVGYWVTWWFGEGFSTANLYSTSGGFFGSWAFLFALAIFLLGVTSYAMILGRIARPRTLPTASQWIGRLVLLPFLATLPVLIVIGMGANNSLAGF